MIRRILFLFTVACIALFLSGCKKDKKKPASCASCVSAPEAKPEFDNSSSGVYKGIITGSSGTLVFYIGNGNEEVKALIAFDGKSAVLTSNSFGGWNPGDAISNALFTGTWNGQPIEAKLSVSAGGLNPSVNLTIPGHTIYVAMFKETSTMLVKSYEGTYKGDASGALNIVMAGDEYTVLTNGQVLTRRTKLVGGKIEFTSSGTSVKGEFVSDDLLKGEWSNKEDGEKGTWEARRTL